MGHRIDPARRAQLERLLPLYVQNEIIGLVGFWLYIVAIIREPLLRRSAKMDLILWEIKNYILLKVRNLW